MASAAGLEPTTHSLGNCCSIQMSYADAYCSYNLSLIFFQAAFIFFYVLLMWKTLFFNAPSLVLVYYCITYYKCYILIFQNTENANDRKI